MYLAGLDLILGDSLRFSLGLKTSDDKRRAFMCARTVLEQCHFCEADSVFLRRLDECFERACSELPIETAESETQFCNLERCLKYLDLTLCFASWHKKIEDAPSVGRIDTVVVVSKLVLSISLLTKPA